MMNLSQMLLATAVLFGSGVASAESLSYWNHFGRVDGNLVSATEFQGTVDYVLTKPLPNGSTTLFTGTVKAISSDGTLTPASIAYTVKFDGGMGWVKLTGVPSEISDADACVWALRVDASADSGRISFTSPATATYAVSPETSIVLRGTVDVCTGAESWNIVGGQMVLIIP